MVLRVAAILAAFSYICMIVRPTATAFSTDSWAYYDLSQTVFSDFYRPATTRSFHEQQGYSRSFPPLWPVLIGATNRLLAQGPQRAVLLASLAALLSLLPLLRIMRACIVRRAPSIVAAVFTWMGLLLYPPYWDEAYGGRAIPITVLLLLTAIACLLTLKPGWISSAGAGLALGAACLARFDALPFALAMLLACMLPRVIQVRSRIALLAAFAVAVSPWVVYSKKRYGALWTSDNSAVAFSAPRAYAMDYRAPSQTGRTDPVLWRKRITVNAVKLALSLAEGVSIHAGLALALASAFVVWTTGRREKHPSTSSIRTLRFATAAAVLGLSGQVLTGYMDRRYFSFACLLATALVVCMIFARGRHLSIIARTGLCFLMLVSMHYTLDWSNRELGAPVASLKIPPEVTTPILADFECHELGSITRHRAICLPSDWERLSDGEKAEFTSRFGITHALVRSTSANSEFEVVPLTPNLRLRTR